jgi:hypothetical protein
VRMSALSVLSALNALSHFEVVHRGVAKSLKKPKWAKGIKNSLTEPLETSGTFLPSRLTQSLSLG